MNILCTGPLAGHPFVIPALNLRIYSGEELCYYIYHNKALLSEPFLTEELLYFIGTELQLPDFADHLAKFSKSEFTVQVMAVLREFAYYPEDKLRVFEKELKNEQLKSPFAKTIDRADAFLSMGQYRAALQIYEALENTPEYPGSSKEALGRVSLCMAYADCALSYYDKAIECLRDAYVRVPDENTAKMSYFVARLAGLSGSSWYEPDEKERSLLEEEYTKICTESRMLEETGELTAIGALDSIRRSKALKKVTEEVKSAYRKNTQTG